MMQRISGGLPRPSAALPGDLAIGAPDPRRGASVSIDIWDALADRLDLGAYVCGP